MKTINFNIVRWNKKFIIVELVLINEKWYIIYSVMKLQYTATLLA